MLPSKGHVLPFKLPLPNKVGLIMAGTHYNLAEQILINTIMASPL